MTLVIRNMIKEVLLANNIRYSRKSRIDIKCIYFIHFQNVSFMLQFNVWFLSAHTIVFKIVIFKPKLESSHPVFNVLFIYKIFGVLFFGVFCTVKIRAVLFIDVVDNGGKILPVDKLS